MSLTDMDDDETPLEHSLPSGMAAEGGEEDVCLCFVCGRSLNAGGEGVVGVKTQFLRIPYPTLIKRIIGDDFVLLVSVRDKMCKKCYHLLNNIDEFEHRLSKLKTQIVQHLQTRYNLEMPKAAVQDEEPDEDWCLLEGETGEDSVVYQLACEVCGELVESSAMDDHIKQHSQDKEAFPPEDTHSRLSDEQDDMSNSVASFDNNLCIEYQDDNGDLDDPLRDNSLSLCCEYCFEEFSSVEEKNKHEIMTHFKEFRIKVEVDDNNTDNLENVKVIKLKGESSTKEGSSDSLTSYNTLFKCGDCGFSNSDQMVVEKHAHEHRVGRFFNCDICEMPFPSQGLLARHQKVHAKSKERVKCNVCDVLCHDSLHLQYHMRNYHDILKRLSCVICKRNFPSNKELKKHVLAMHSGKKSYKCDECGMTFLRHAQFENHKVYVHGPKQCKICNKHIEDAAKLRQHEKRHARTDTVKFECDVCQRVFKTPGGLRVHKVSHTGNYKFFCEFCGKGFMSIVIMEEHKGVHTREERYICDLCGRKFVLYSTFHLHKQWHKDPFPFPCKVCGRKFKYRSERANHIRKDHTGELPHKCSYCPAEFLKAAYLKKHLIIHTKQYPFRCDICFQEFDQKRSYARHMARVHQDPSLLNSSPKKCQFKITLRPDEYPDLNDDM